jgi:hypothetical protein
MSCNVKAILPSRLPPESSLVKLASEVSGRNYQLGCAFEI